MTTIETTARAGLEPVAERGWRRGLPNLLATGFHAWWGTSTWWTHALIWLGVTNVPLATLLWSDADTGQTPPVTIFAIMSMFGAVAVAIIMQDEIVGEKKSGTAAWVLSKPVSRTAFVIAKLVPNGVGMLATMVLIPGVTAYGVLAVAGVSVEPLGYLAGLGVVALNLTFYLTLTLMLGTLLDSAGAVIGIALAFAFGQQFLNQLPMLGQLLPWALIVPINDNEVSNASALMLGQAPPAPMAILVAAIASVLFTVVAIRQFNRTEF